MKGIVQRNQLDEYKSALLKPESAEQVMDIEQKARGLVKAFKDMKGFEDEYYKAFELMIEACRILGVELLKVELKPWGDQTSRDSDRISLSSLGITARQSKEWRAIAKLPTTEIEAYVKARRDNSEEATKKAILDLAEAYKTAKEKTQEKAELVQIAMSAFCIKARDLIDHLRNFPDTNAREGISKEFLELLPICEETVNELNRATL